jgi:hypothetical protein
MIYHTQNLHFLQVPRSNAAVIRHWS